jgi:hypothetical protein
MDPIITIETSGSDAATALGVTLSTVTTQTQSTSVAAIDARLAAYPAQLKAIQDAQAADQALRDSIAAVFAAAGVTDLTQPLTPDQVTAINTANDTANQATAAAQVAVLTPLASPAQPALAQHMQAQS